MNIIQRPADPSNYQAGRTHEIDQITFHHIVGNAPGGTDSFCTPHHGVSSTYAISASGIIYQYVQEGDTPWTDANLRSNARSITIEHAGPPYAEGMYKASIELCRDIRSRHNITRFVRHRDVSDTPTACPGDLNVERIVKESGEDMPELLNDGDVVNLYQGMLGRQPSATEIAIYTGKDWKTCAYAFMASDEFKTRLAKTQPINKGDVINYLSDNLK